MLEQLAPAIARLDWLEALYLGAGEDARKKPWFERSILDKKLCNAARALPGALVDAASPRLTLLDLDSLGLEHLPERIAALTGLTSLGLRYNRIGADGARALAALTGLTSLGLRYNRIGDDGARALAALTGLTSLNLGGNSDINLSALCALQKLQSIQLDGYKISDPCPAFWELQLLTNVDLNNVQLGYVPPEFIGYDCLNKLRAYFKDLKDGHEILTDVKFMILGNGRIGKTQICRRLRNEEFDEKEDSTHGILISEATLPAQADNDEPIRLKIWDFGGQDIYLGIHALFLKSRALFPIVWRAKSEKRKEHTHKGLTFRNYPLDYWVQYVLQMANDKSPVIVIQNQVNSRFGLSQTPPISKLLLERLAKSHWYEPISYSAKTKNRHDILLGTLREAVAYIHDLQGEQRIGKVHAAVKKRLEAMQQKAQEVRKARLEALANTEAGELDGNADGQVIAHNIENARITRKRFNEICAEEGGVASTDVLLGYLHQIGTVYHSKDLFEGDIIVDQQWALDAIYAVFERSSGAYNYLRNIRGGRFTRSELAAHVWIRLRHDDDEQELFISMMRSCGICFRLHQGNNNREAEYIAPDLLPPRADIDGLLVRDWDEKAETERAAFTYELLSPGLMRSLMTKIGEDAGARADYWKDGFYFYDSTTRSRAIIEQTRAEDEKDRGWSGRIDIRTQAGADGSPGGHGARELLQRLCKLVDETNERFGVTTSEFTSPSWYERLLQPGKAASRGKTIAAAEKGRALVSEAAGQRRTEDDDDQAKLRIEPAFEPSKTKQFYISYAWGGDETKEDRQRARAVDQLCAKAKARGIHIVRDKDNMKYRGLISDFMEDIANSPNVIIILSEKYLKSHYCLHELYRIYEKCTACKPREDWKAEFLRRVTVVQLSCANISGDNRLVYSDYWAEQRDIKHEQARKRWDDHRPNFSIQDEHKKFKKYAEDLDDILYILSDQLALQFNTDEEESKDFAKEFEKLLNALAASEEEN